jgi:uncharacterized membrane protein
MDWRPLLRHDHWLTIRFGNHHICLCARCSGTVLGFVSTLLLAPFFFLAPYRTLAPSVQIILALLLALPSGIDWITQKWGLRKSNNPTRFLVGTMIGSGACFLGSSSLSSRMESLILASSAIFVMLIGHLGKGVLKNSR